MPTLAPRQTFDVAIENPVERPSTLKALSGLIDAGTKLVGQIESAEPNLELGLVQGLEQAGQLRAQGDVTGALQMERRVLTNYSIAGGDPSDGRTQEIIRTYTGRDPQSVGFSQEEMLFQEISDPDSELGKQYNRALLASQGMKPDGSDEEQHELAMSLMVKDQANDMLIAEAQYNWTNATRGAMLDRISNFGNLALGSLNQIAKQGGTVNLEDIQSTRVAFMQFRAELEARRPANVSNDEWGQIKEALDQRQEQIEYLEGLAAPGNLDARATAEFMRAVEEADIPSVDKNIAIRLMSEDPGLLMDRGIASNTNFNQSMSTVIRHMQEGPTGMTTGDVRDGNTWDTTAMETADGQPMSASEAQEFTKAASTVMTMAKTSLLANNSDMRDNWGMAAVRGLSGLMAIGEAGTAVSPQLVNGFFSNKFFADLEAIKSTDPALYNNIVSKASRVLGQQQTVIGQKFSVVGQGSPFEYNVNDGTFRLNRERAQQVMPKREFNALDSSIDRLYDGNWSAAFEDNGAKLYESTNFNDPGLVAWQRIAGSRTSVPKNLADMGKAYHSITAAMRKVTGMSPAATSIPGGDISTSNSAIQSTRLMDFIDRSEGGGDYNALLGFTNRPGKAFEGTQITTKTIGELKEFTSRSGAYGQWTMNWKRENNHGNPNVPSTPLGRYQFVGTTLASVAKRMGLSDDVVFTPQVQDAMFHFHVNELIEGKSDTAAAKVLKNTWEGFKNYTDAEMQQAVAEFRGTPAPALTTMTGGASDPGMETTPEGSEETTTFNTDVDVSTAEAELDQTEQQGEAEQGTASRAVNREQRQAAITRIMERLGVTEERAKEILEIAEGKE